MLDWYRSLVRLRREIPDLRGGAAVALEVVVEEAQGTIVIRRGRVTIAANLSGESRSVEASGIPRLASRPGSAQTAGTVSLPPDSVVILVRD